jgi:hypothetical protein
MQVEVVDQVRQLVDQVEQVEVGQEVHFQVQVHLEQLTQEVEVEDPLVQQQAEPAVQESLS